MSDRHDAGPAATTVQLKPPAEAAGILAGRYELLGEIGTGGMGVVHRARDRETGEMLAIKVLRPEIAADPAMVERFKNELRLARRITHKHVCRIHDLHRAGEVAFITMEYVDGDSLRMLLKRQGALPPARVVAIARQICAGLSEAHAQGVVHRDLKPENVMVTRAGVVKLLDFGIARPMDSLATTTQTLIGTPAYMAPEQAMGRPADARTDIYALGLLLYESLTGRSAFSGNTPVEVALKQVQERPVPPTQLRQGVPPALERVVLRCLEKDPARRFASAEALAAALSEAQAPVCPARRRALWIGAAVVVVVVGVAGVWKHWRTQRAAAPAIAGAGALAPAEQGVRSGALEPRPDPEARGPVPVPAPLLAAAEAGDAEAQFRLARMLAGGPKGARDERKAYEWLRRAAESGHAEAQFALARLYERGPPRLRDPDRARQWYERAAAQGHAEARALLSAPR